MAFNTIPMGGAKLGRPSPSTQPNRSLFSLGAPKPFKPSPDGGREVPVVRTESRTGPKRRADRNLKKFSWE